MRGRVLLTITLGMTFLCAALISGTGSVVAQDDTNASAAIAASEAEKGATDATEEKKSAANVKPSDKKGKYYFKKSCKSCHGKDGDGGEVTPISKTIKQWERYFKKDKHYEDEKLDVFDAEQLIHIRFFLINHAADSDQPETCG